MKTLVLQIAMCLTISITFGQNNNISIINRWALGPCYTSEVLGDYLFMGNGSHMEIHNISDPVNPQLVSSFLSPGVVRDIWIEDTLVYIADGNKGLRIINISNINEPEEIGFLDTPKEAAKVFISGDYAFLINKDLLVIDISDPYAPQQVGMFPSSHPALYFSDVFVVENYAYIASGNDGLRILDISDFSNINEIGNVDVLHVRGVYVEGHYAYLISLCGGHIIDISDPANPIEISSFVPTGYGGTSLIKKDNYLYIAGGFANIGMMIYEISDPYNPNEIGFYYTEGYKCEIAIKDDFAYAAFESDGLHIIDISNPCTINMVGHVSTSGKAFDVSVIDTIAYVADGAEGLRIIDVSDPFNPNHISQYFTNGYATHIKTSENLVFMSDDYYFRIIDVSNPYLPVQIGGYYGGSSDDFDISDSSAYICSNHELEIIDISDPVYPNQIGSYTFEPSWLRAYAICVSDYIAFVSAYDDNSTNENGIYIIDVSNASEPELLSYLEYPQFIPNLQYNNNLVYAVDDLGNLTIIDVSNPSQPEEINSIQFDRPLTSLKILGQFAYLVPEEIGDLIVVDISDPYNLFEVDRYYGINHFSKNVFVLDTLAYMASTWSGFNILNISMSGDLSLKAQIETRGTSKDFSISGDHLFLANGKFGMSVLDLNDPGNFQEINSFQVEGEAKDIWVSDNYAFITDYPTDLKIIDIHDVTNLTQIGYYNGGINGVCAEGNYAYLLKHANILYITDISNPAIPQLVGSYTPAGGWDIFISGYLLYVTGYQGGLDIFNVSDPSNPIHLSQFYIDYNNVFDVYATDTLAFVAYEDLGLRILDVSDPSNPVEIGYYIGGDTRGIWVEDNLAYVAIKDFGLKVLDVIDPYNPVEIASFESGGQPSLAIPYGDYIYLSDGDAGVYVLEFDYSGINRRSIANERKEFELIGNYPNPFSMETIIEYKVFSNVELKMEVFNSFGCKFTIMCEKNHQPGEYKVSFQNIGLPSGLYYYKLSTRNSHQNKKMIIY